MSRHFAFLVCLLAVYSIAAAELPDNHSEGLAEITQKIIVIGDIHGDYDQFAKLLRTTGLINKRNKWVGGNAHLIQMGDIPDRGPDSRKAMDLLMKLEKSAVKKGGLVTVLIGNHESMMLTNDLRYVHPGEYSAFKDKNSKARRKAYYKHTIDYLRANTPVEGLPKFDVAYRKNWEQRFPLGYVEHRTAWAPTGTYGKWALSHPAVAKVGDSLFAHGGLSPKYAAMPIQEINTRIRTELVATTDPLESTVFEDDLGPLWYRGWANLPETAENEAILDEVLRAFGVKRMVIAHTPLLSVVLPRFGGKVVIVDVGLSEHYGNGFSALEITDGVAVAIIGEQRLVLPTSADGTDAYLDTAAGMLESDDKIARYRDMIKAAEESVSSAAQGTEPAQQTVQ